MAKYMGKSSDEIWKIVMGNKQQSGQQEQTAAQTGAKTGASGGRYSGMSADDIWKSVMEGGGQETSQTGLGTASSDTGYQKWLRDYDTVSNKYYSWAKKNSGEGKWQADSFGGTKEAMESLLDQYDDISKRLDEKDKTQFQKAYDGLKQTYNALSESGKYYAQFRDQDDYDRARSGYTNFGVGYAAESYGLDDAQARALRQEQVQKDAREQQRALAEYVSAKKEFTPVDQEYRLHSMDDRDGVPYTAEYEEDLNSRYNQARAKVTAAENALLSARNRMDAYNATWGKIDQYAKYADAAKNEDTSYTGASFDEIKDYEYKLENEPIHSDREALAPAEVQDKYLSGWLAQNPEPNMDDSLGLWLSMTEEQREHAKLSSFPTLQTLWNTANDGLWDALNDTEIQTYYYLRHNQGQEAALQYLKDLNPELNRRTDEAFIETVQNASTAGRWGYEAAAYGLNLIGNVEAGVGELGEMITGNHNPYSNTSRAQRYAGYIRGINKQSVSKFAEDVAKNAGASEEFAAGAAKYAENTYQAITSGFDSAIGATVFGPAYLPIMGLGAMAQKSSDLELRGASNRQIAVGAVGAGCIEMLFEKVSLDHFFENFIKTPPKSWKELIAKTLVQAGIEGNEEINTEIANIAFDAINMGKNCDVSMSIREYMAQGLSEEEAKKRATVDAVTDIYWAGFGGFVSGGAMAGASGTAKMGLSKAANAMGNYDVGKPLLENGRVADLQQQAESLTDAKKSAKLSKAAQEVAHNASVGDNSLLNTYKTGKVASQIAREAGREASRAEVTEFRNAAEKYLAGQRDIKNKKHALNVLTRAFEGTTTVPGDKAAMRRWGNQMTREILEGIGGKETLQENAKARAASAIQTAVDVQSSVLGFEPTRGETAFEYNQEGDTQAYLKDSSDPVNIRAEDPVAKIENGKMWLNTDDGQTVEADNVSFGTAEDASLASIVSRMNITADQANSLYAARTESGMSAKSYATALQNAYLKGFSGVTYNGIQDYSSAAKLPGDVRRTAWEAGRQMRNRQTTEQAAKISKGTQMVNQRGLTFTDSAKSIKNLNEQQKAGIAAAKALAAAGLHIEVYASTEAERKSGAPNGIYRSSDGTIHVDLNAGDNGQGTVAYAVAHEATHFIKDWSATKYQTYADILIEAAESKGISYDSLLDRQLAKQSALEENRGKTAEELQQLAYDETIAEMSETMLTDTDAAKRVSQELYKKDRTLWEKIRDFFTGLVEKLRSAYKGLDPDSDMGRITRQAIRDNEKVAQAWAEALVEAGENYSAGQTGAYEDLLDVGTQTEETSGAAQNKKSEELLQNTQQVEEAETAETETRSAETKTVSEGELSDTDKRRERLKDYLNEAWSKGDGSAELRDALQRMWSDEYNLNFRTDEEYRKYMEDTLPDLEAGDTKTIAQVRQDFAAPTAKFVHENRVNAERDAVRNLNMRNRAYENARNIYGENSAEANTARYFVTDAEQKLQKIRGLNEGMYAALEGRNSEHERVTRRYQDLAYKEFYGREAALDGQKNNARGGERYSLRDKKSPTRAELERKNPIQVVDISTNSTSGNFKERRAAIRENAKEIIRKPYLNADTNTLIFLTAKSYTHVFSNAGELQISAAEHLPELVENAVLTHSEPPTHGNEHTRGVYTFFAAGSDSDGTVYPIKLKVKEIGNDGQQIPANISNYLGDNFEDFSTLYDSVVLAVDEIEDLPGSVHSMTDKAAEKKYPGKSPEVRVADLLDLVKGDAEKYIPKREDVRKSSRNVRDSEYMELAKDPEGNRETLQQMVKQAARDAGYTEVAYHGTHSDFTVFDKKTIGNNFGAVSDLGFYFTPYYEDARGFSTDFGKKGAHVLKGALRFSNPLVVEDTGWGSAIEQTDTRHGDLLRWAREGNHDGIIVRSLDDEFQDDDGNYDTVYVAFDSNQFKVLDPVTYDDSGNVIPLSQRFDTGNEDIRYSSRNSQESQVDRLARKNEELKAEAEYLKQVVQIQKRGNTRNLRDRESVNAIAKGILESVNAKDTEFGKKLNDFYRALQTEEMDYSEMQKRAGALADWALEHHQAERDGYAQEVLDFLKKRRVSLTDSQIGDAEYTYGSLNEFKKAIRGSIIIDQNSTTSLDQLWQEAAAQFPDRFDAETVAADMPDGIANIVSWANSAEADSETEFQYNKAETKADLTQKILMGFLDAKPVESVSDTLKQQMKDMEKQHKKEMRELRKSWDAEAKAMEQSYQYDLEAERKRGEAAVEALRYQQEAVQKAQDGLWETERAEIKRSYEKQMKDMEDASDAEMKVMQQEFFRVVREWEKSGKTINELQKQVKELQKGWEDEAKAMELSHQYDLDAEKLNTATVQREFSRLLREYDASDRKVDRLEAKVKQQREAAEAKVESRKKTEERHKLQNTVDTLNRMLLRPTNTSHVPQELQSSVATALDIINQKILDDKSLENARRIRQYAEQIEALQRRPAEAQAQEIENLQKRIDRLLRENNNGKNDSRIAELNKELLKVRNKQEEVDTDKIAELNRKIKNLTGKDTSMKAALTSLQEQYRKLEGQEGDMFDSNIDALIENAMQDIGNTAYKDLSSEQLKAVRDAYTALLTNIRKANKTFVAWQDASISDLVKRVTGELSVQKRKKPTQTAIRSLKDKFSWNNEKPVYAFERIGSAVMSELYSNLRKGEDTFARDISEARDFFLGATEKYGYSKWNMEDLQEFEASDGRKFQLSLDERMSLYAYSLRPQAREHLNRGGIVLSENTRRAEQTLLGVTKEVIYNDANAYTLTNETIDAIVGSLTKEQQQFAYEMQQYLAKVMGAKGDEVNMAKYGIKKFTEDTYWPLKSSSVFSERVLEQQRAVNKWENSGFTKALTQHANNAIELSPLVETWAQHVNDMSTFHALVLPMADFTRVYNWNQKGDIDGKRTMGVRQMIQQTSGKAAVDYIDQFLQDLNGGLRADPRETVERALLSSFKKSAVSASLSVAIQQPSAIGRAFAFIEANYFVGAKVEDAGGIKKAYDQMKKYSGIAVIKEMGRYDVGMGQSTIEYIVGRNSLGTWGKITGTIDELAGKLPELGDQITWVAIWEAAKRKTAAQNPGLRGEALLKKSAELFEYTLERSQVYDSVFSRSANMRAKTGLMSMVTAFMAEPTTTANMVSDAIRKFKSGDKRMAGKMLSSVAVATVLNAALAAVVYAARDDDDTKTYWEKYLASLASETIDSFNPLTYVPVVADINNLLLGYSIERTDMKLASDFVTDLKKLATLYGKFDPEWDEEEQKEWEKKIQRAWFDNALMAGTILGLPLKNVARDVEAVINTYTNPSKKAPMSADTVAKAVKESLKKSIPIYSWKADESSSDQLYDAITQGKDVLAKRLKAQYGDEKKYESALLKGLRENDPRIKTAAQYALDGKTPERVAIIREIVAEGNYTQDQVIKAINQKANSMKGSSGGTSGDTPQKLYDYEEYVPAAANGLGYADEVRKELIRYQADRNQEKDEKLTRAEAEEAAEKTFKSNVKSETKDGYAAGELTEAQVRKVLTAAGVVKDEALDKLMLQWNTELELGSEIEWTDSRYVQFARDIQPAGISVSTYDEYIQAVSKMHNIDEDGDGKDEIKKQEQVIEYIDSMPISDAQKDILFQAEYPTARKSVLRKLPWR